MFEHDEINSLILHPRNCICVYSLCTLETIHAVTSSMSDRMQGPVSQSCKGCLKDFYEPWRQKAHTHTSVTLSHLFVIRDDQKHAPFLYRYMVTELKKKIFVQIRNEIFPIPNLFMYELLVVNILNYLAADHLCVYLLIAVPTASSDYALFTLFCVCFSMPFSAVGRKRFQVLQPRLLCLK